MEAEPQAAQPPAEVVAPEPMADGPIDLDGQYLPVLLDLIGRNDTERAAGRPHETDEALGQRLEDDLRGHLARAQLDPDLARGVVDRAFEQAGPPDPESPPAAPMAPDDWIATLHERLANPAAGDDPAAMRALIGETRATGPRRLIPPDFALPLAMILRAVAARLEPGIAS